MIPGRSRSDQQSHELVGLRDAFGGVGVGADDVVTHDDGDVLEEGLRHGPVLFPSGKSTVVGGAAFGEGEGGAGDEGSRMLRDEARCGFGRMAKIVGGLAQDSEEIPVDGVRASRITRIAFEVFAKGEDVADVGFALHRLHGRIDREGREDGLGGEGGSHVVDES